MIRMVYDCYLSPVWIFFIMFRMSTKLRRILIVVQGLHVGQQDHSTWSSKIMLTEKSSISTDPWDVPPVAFHAAFNLWRLAHHLEQSLDMSTNYGLASNPSKSSTKLFPKTTSWHKQSSWNIVLPEFYTFTLVGHSHTTKVNFISGTRYDRDCNASSI